MELSKGIKGALVIAVLSLINIVSCSSYLLAVGITVIEYALLYYYMFTGKVKKAFYCYLVFLSVSLEMNSFVYLGGNAPFERWSFYNPITLYRFSSLLLFFLLFQKYHNVYIIKSDSYKYLKWLKLLLYSGLVSVFLGMIVNDNGISDSGLYPSAIINPLINYIILFFLFYCTMMLITDENIKNDIEVLCKNVLLGVSIASIISILMGYDGYYGYEYKIMLAPMISGFSPCLFMFVKKAPKKEKLIYLIVPIIVIILAFSKPSVIGSKWYLMIACSLLYILYDYLPQKNPVILIFISGVFIFVLPFIGEVLSGLMATDDFNNWKFNQVLKMLDMSSYSSFQLWFLAQDTSAKFRIDEPINIAIEYLHKPWFALFGKGIAGTTLHYTNFCDWTDSSAFLANQVKYGFYSEMHESTAVIFLRHGLVGIAFLVSSLVMCLKKAGITPFSVIGAIWLLFYWSYGTSFQIGAVALVLALVSQPQERKNKNTWLQ